MGDSGNGDGRLPRKHERHAVELPVTIVDDVGKTSGTIQFDTADLSLGGAFMRSSLLFEVDEELGLELTLAPGQTVRARGKVVRVVRDGPAGMGIAFTSLDERDREAIRSFLTKG
jgi:c-di-GMP-binding flagellar brake protein YcgR